MDETRPDGTADGTPDDAFVDATLSRILGDPDVRLSVLLAAYRVPAPSPRFVARVLAHVPAAAAPVPRTNSRWPLLVAAATLLVAAGLWFGRGATAPEVSPIYPSFSAALGQHAARHPHADAPPLDGFFRSVSFAADDGLALLAGGPR